MRISDILTADPVTISDAATLGAAAAAMDEHGIRHLPVVRAGSLVGILSDRDLLAQGGWLQARLGDELELTAPLVRQAMHGAPLCVSPDDSVSDAAQLLVDQDVGCLPVTQGRRLVGIVSAIDVLEALVAAERYGRAGDARVESEMQREVVTIAPEATLADAVDRMRDGGFRHLPVVDGGRLCGIVSDRDVRRAVGRNLPEEIAITALMTPRPTTARPTDPLARAARELVRERIGALPVLDADGHLAGILTVTDLLALAARVLDEPS